MRDRFVEGANASVELVASGGGVFEVFLDDDLRYSKKALGRFPDDMEVDAMVAAAGTDS